MVAAAITPTGQELAESLSNFSGNEHRVAMANAARSMFTLALAMAEIVSDAAAAILGSMELFNGVRGGD